VAVLSFKFHQNRLSSYRDVSGQNLAHCMYFGHWLIQQPVPPYRPDVLLDTIQLFELKSKKEVYKYVWHEPNLVVLSIKDLKLNKMVNITYTSRREIWRFQ